jgi:hypothetical protein
MIPSYARIMAGSNRPLSRLNTRSPAGYRTRRTRDSVWAWTMSPKDPVQPYVAILFFLAILPE